MNIAALGAQRISLPSLLGIITTVALAVALLAPAQAHGAGVKRSVTLTAPSSPTVGSTGAFYGVLSKSPRGSTVEIFSRTGSNPFKKVAKVKTKDADGSFVYKVRFASDTPISFKAVAPKRKVGKKTLKAASSRVVTVSPRIMYRDVFIDDEWTPFDGSASPGFEGDYQGDGLYGFGARFSQSAPVGQEAYVTWDMKQKCTTGQVHVMSATGGIFGADIRMAADADGVELFSVDLGYGQDRLREIDVTGRSKLTITATFLGPGGTNRGALAQIVGDSVLRCETTLQTTS